MREFKARLMLTTSRLIHMHRGELYENRADDDSVSVRAFY